ncbi:MAG: hypothetical protein KatS3mg015_2224 [Fimbriimonadales bacterium]|nr:MAG: hypothetical protein KatS3mg015_2224 [Fimbriimonadales bacterium]
MVALVFGAGSLLVAAGMGGWLASSALRSFGRLGAFCVCAMLGYGLIGTLSFLLFLLFGTQSLLPLVVLLFLAVPGWFRLQKTLAGADFRWIGFLPAVLVLALLALRLPAALSPSGSSDWDTLSHQLAMAKIWLDEGRVSYIPFMPHSNVPATVNMLYVWGLKFGGQYAAKILTVLFLFLSSVGLGAIAAKRYGATAGTVTLLTVVATPVLLWEAGTGYVDIAHGFWVALGVIALGYAWEAEKSDARDWLLVSGLSLGLALGSKYTAIPIAAFLLVALCAMAYRRRVGTPAVVAVAVCLAVAAPWYVRNAVNTGNPFYPFLYSVFDGRNWSAENEEAWRAEQTRFGIGVRDDRSVDWLALPGSLTALALQPDRQINGGSPFGAIGPVFVLAFFLWLALGRRGAMENLTWWVVAGAVVVWFASSQQSRYLSAEVMAIALLGGGLVETRARAAVAVAVGALTLWSLLLFGYFNRQELAAQIAATMGTLSEDEYLEQNFDAWDGVSLINSLEAGDKVALYDEVRGFYITVPYLWANPQHSTLIPYDNLKDGAELAAALHKLGCTFVYVSTSPVVFGPARAARWRHQLDDPNAPIEETERFRRLILDAVRSGAFRLRSSTRSGLLYEIVFPNEGTSAAPET